MLSSIAVFSLNGFPVPFFPVYQPPNVYPGRLVLPSVLPAFSRFWPFKTVSVTFGTTAVASSAALSYVSVTSEFGIHFAYTVMLVSIGVSTVNRSPDPFLSVYQPPKM